MDPRLRENAKRLQLRPKDFPALLEELGFGPPQHLGTPGEGGTSLTSRDDLPLLADRPDLTGFHRPVDLYAKK